MGAPMPKTEPPRCPYCGQRIPKKTNTGQAAEVHGLKRGQFVTLPNYWQHGKEKTVTGWVVSFRHAMNGTRVGLWDGSSFAGGCPPFCNNNCAMGYAIAIHKQTRLEFPAKD